MAGEIFFLTPRKYGRARKRGVSVPRPLLDCYDRSLRVLAHWALESMLFMSWLFWVDPRKQHFAPHLGQGGPKLASDGDADG
jgi:hypothetical protein